MIYLGSSSSSRIAVAIACAGGEFICSLIVRARTERAFEHAGGT
jgi:hypothetical protein